MSDEKFIHLQKKIKQRVATTSWSKSKFLIQYRYFSLGLAVFAAANTFLVALSQFGADPNENFAIAALVVSALITIVTAWQASVNPKDKFIKNADALNEIMDLKEQIEWRQLNKKAPLTETELDDWFKKFRKLEKELFGSIAKSSIQDAE